MGDEENRMPKNARREKNSKKESEREREKKKEKQKEKERERAARERTAIQYGETRRTVALYQKVPATYIYIYSLHIVNYIYIVCGNNRSTVQLATSQARIGQVPPPAESALPSKAPAVQRGKKTPGFIVGIVVLRDL